MVFAKEHNDQIALIFKEQELSYSQLKNNICIISENLKKNNIKKGDRVAYFNKNSIHFSIIYMALNKIGAILVPINIRFPANQLIALLDSIDCKHIVISRDYIDEGFEREHVLYVEDLELDLKACDSINDYVSEPKFNDFIRRESSIIFTSGSTGSPKAAVHTFANHYYSALGSNNNILFGPGDRWLLALPVYHVGGISIVFRAAVGGGTVVVPDTNLDLIDSIDRYNISHVSVVPTLLTRLIQKESNVEILKNMKAILIGGSAIPNVLIKQCYELGLNIFVTYGSTELSSQVTTSRPNADLDELFTAGEILEHREIMITEHQEILVRGKTLFKGYLQDENILKSRDEDGWFHTDDLGKIDEQGRLTVFGRRDNMFISGGENIQPEEIESELCKIDSVMDAVVIPKEHEEYGQRPVAFVKTKDDTDYEFLRQILLDKLPKYKVPDEFYPFPKCAQSTGIKINRSYFKQALKNRGASDIINSLF